MDIGRSAIKSAQLARPRGTDAVENRIGKVPLLGRYHESPREVDHDFVLTGKVLGSAGNGVVHMAIRKNSFKIDEGFAVKVFEFGKMSGKAVASLKAEVQTFLSLDHPHICRLVNVYQSPLSLSLVMEYMAGGDLLDRVSAVQRFQEWQAAQAAHQMLLAVHYLHCHGIVHGDLKLDNFMYEKKSGDLLKLIDFGFSKVKKPDAKMKPTFCKLSYVKPEVIIDTCTRPWDLWCLGIIVFFLMSGSMPFKGSGRNGNGEIAATDSLMNDQRLAKSSNDAVAFTTALLQKDPALRLTAMQAIAHPWLHSLRKKSTLILDSSMLMAFHEYCKAPAFRRSCLVAMAWLVPSNESEHVCKEFCAIDTERQGTISMNQFKATMVQKFQVADNDVVSIFQALDANHDDEIHYSEFLAAMLSTRIEVNDKLIDSTFRNFDKELSGYITADNLRDALGSDYEGRGVENILMEVDVSNDGRISYPEFAAYVRGTPVQQDRVQKTQCRNLQTIAETTAVEGAQQSCCSIM